MRWRVLVLVASLFAAVAAAPAAYADAPLLLAASEDDDMTEEVGEGGSGAAVDAPASEEEEDEQPWTARFLAPTVLALGLLGLLGSVLYYMLQIRRRYTVTE